jgi:hypothetical protein
LAASTALPVTDLSRSAGDGPSRIVLTAVEAVRRGLSRDESRRLLEHQGLSDPAAVDRVVALARGNPLLLGMAAEIGRSGPQGFEDVRLSADVGRALVTRMTREIADPTLRRLLEAACLVRTFNEELLADMLQVDVAQDFDRLCDLSVVRVVQGGARVHDLVREAVSADLQWRAPTRHAELRARLQVPAPPSRRS